MKYRIAAILLLLEITSIRCSYHNTTNSSFSTSESGQGVELLDDGHPVFFYQRKAKSPDGKSAFNNYLHPLYSLRGDTLTEEFPEDHPHHRGIFWAWHQLYINDKKIGDSWSMENISYEVKNLTTTLGKEEARFNINVLWKSSAFPGGEPFVEETTTITVYQRQTDIRKIDFEIVLKPLVNGVQLGGSEDLEKGYGGFSTRIKLPEGLVFTSTKGSVTPVNGQVAAGAWMDFSTHAGQGENSGMAILCHPTTPNYPAPWILRQTGSMQNVVFPGALRIPLSMQEPIVLRYRLIIHMGDASRVDIPALQSEYEKMYRDK